MREAATVLRSWKEIQDRISDIIESLNKHRDLAAAAIANPFLALEELGYYVVPEARSDIEDRLRFPPADAARRQHLRTRIFEAAGQEFDIQSHEALHRVLYHDLELKPYPDERGCTPPYPDTHSLPHRTGSDHAAPDPLELLIAKHPIVDPLLEYRRLDAERRPFAPAAGYREIRRGKAARQITQIRFRLKGDQEGRSDRGGSRGSDTGGTDV